MKLHEAIERAKEGDVITKSHHDYGMKIDEGKLINTNDGSPIIFYIEWLDQSDWQIIKTKQEPVSAMVWVDEYMEGKKDDLLYSDMRTAFKAGAKNERLYYAGLVELVKDHSEHCMGLIKHKFEKELQKIKQHQEE